MSRLADPTLCPDCRGPISSDAVCVDCGLALAGPLAGELWRSMLASDTLVERLRAGQASGAETPAATPASRAGRVAAARPSAGNPAGPPSFPAMPPVAAHPARGGLSGRAVPMVLLGLGGLCVLVAASIFLAFTWQILPLEVRALLMLSFTVAVATVAAALSRKGLRGSAETTWALVSGLVALDLAAAHGSGLLGLDALSDRTMTTGTGLVLVGLGAAVGTWAAGTAIRRCVAGEVTLVLGVLVVTAAQVWDGRWSDGASATLGVPVLVAVAALLRNRFREASYAVLGLALLTWADLVLIGTVHGLTASGRTALWRGFDGWPLLVAAGYAALVVAVRRLPEALRTVAAGAALLCLSGLALLPPEWATADVLLLAGVLVILALIARVGTRPWALAAAVLGGLGAVVTACALVLSPADWALTFTHAHPVWSTSPGVRLEAGDGPSAWTLLALVVASLAVCAAGLRLLGDRADDARPVLVVAAPGAVALAIATGLAGSQLPMWVVVAGFAAAGSVAVLATLRVTGGTGLVGLALGGEAAMLALIVASRSDLVTAVLATALTLVAASLFVASRRSTEDVLLATIAAGATVLGGTYAVAAWTIVDGAARTVRAETMTGVACLAILAAAYVAPRRVTRLTVEASGALVGVSAVVLASPVPGTLALVLTVLGTAVALLSVLEEDRVHLGWLGGAVLTAGTVVRLDTPHALGPEVYSLPAAALLVGAGLRRLLADPRSSTWRTLGSGVTLALAPSALIALPDPSSLRGLLVAVGATVAVTLGARQRWQAPFLVGAAALGLLALRILLPLAYDVLTDPLGAWLLFGSIGAGCLTAGVLWERSLHNLRLASRYLAYLR